ncbi:CPBP family intramembrane glutamic endopeptidase [Massilia glaciei]|uniref:CPBP family intramembrane glutamic endopeptidase n=1 Tax=Massilia glaciei TaxID=1524097 RepID=UPI0015E80F16|nr:CPBP family intramembrane glutamic endopeptidase [Massilia glaciei]
MSAADTVTGAAKPKHLRLALAWGIASALAIAAVLPYVFAAMPAMLAKLPVSLPVFAAIQIVQGSAIIALLSWIGLRLGQPLGLDSPFARALVYRTPFPRVSKKALAGACLAGLITGAVLSGLDKAFEPFMPAMTQPLPAAGIAFWKRIVASFYGGIAEELICRLFLMTVISWIVWKTVLKGKTAPSGTAVMIGIVGAALLFGIAHLGAAAQLWPLTPVVIAKVIALNAIGGIVFGLIFSRRGLEHAMCAHFCADIVIQSVAAMA